MSDKPYTERTGGSYVRDPDTRKERLQTPPTAMPSQAAPARPSRAAPAVSTEPKPAPAEPVADKKGK